MNVLPRGSISRATMVTEDLVHAFLDVLDEFDITASQRIRKEYADVVADMSADRNYTSCYEWRIEDNDIKESAHYMLEELFDALNELADPGYYFGSHPGDGSDYGFWMCEEDYE